MLDNKRFLRGREGTFTEALNSVYINYSVAMCSHVLLHHATWYILFATV